MPDATTYSASIFCHTLERALDWGLKAPRARTRSTHDNRLWSKLAYAADVILGREQIAREGPRREERLRMYAQQFIPHTLVVSGLAPVVWHLDKTSGLARAKGQDPPPPEIVALLGLEIGPKQCSATKSLNPEHDRRCVLRRCGNPQMRPHGLWKQVCESPDRVFDGAGGRRQRDHPTCGGLVDDYLLEDESADHVRAPAAAAPLTERCDDGGEFACARGQASCTWLRFNERQELIRLERTTQKDRGTLTKGNDLGERSNMIVVPVTRNNSSHGLTVIHVDLREIVNGRWPASAVVDTGVDDHPAAFAHVHDHTLPEAGAEQRDLKLVWVRRGERPTSPAHDGLPALAGARTPVLCVTTRGDVENE